MVAPIMDNDESAVDRRISEAVSGFGMLIAEAAGKR